MKSLTEYSWFIIGILTGIGITSAVVLLIDREIINDFKDIYKDNNPKLKD